MLLLHLALTSQASGWRPGGPRGKVYDAPFRAGGARRHRPCRGIGGHCSCDRAGAVGGSRQEPVRKPRNCRRPSRPRSYGFYSKGCFSGGVAIATDGPTWQAMRLSRNRRWGHPVMIKLVEKLSRAAAADGWPGLLIGDISQPRGGPMLTGSCLAPDRPRRRHLADTDARPPHDRPGARDHFGDLDDQEGRTDG